MNKNIIVEFFTNDEGLIVPIFYTLSLGDGDCRYLLKIEDSRNIGNKIYHNIMNVYDHDLKDDFIKNLIDFLNVETNILFLKKHNLDFILIYHDKLRLYNKYNEKKLESSCDIKKISIAFKLQSGVIAEGIYDRIKMGLNE